MIVIIITLKTGIIREENVIRYYIDNNVLVIEKNVYERGKSTKFINKCYPLYNVISYEIFNEKIKTRIN